MGTDASVSTDLGYQQAHQKNERDVTDSPSLTWIQQRLSSGETLSRLRFLDPLLLFGTNREDRISEKVTERDHFSPLYSITSVLNSGFKEKKITIDVHDRTSVLTRIKLLSLSPSTASFRLQRSCCVCIFCAYREGSHRLS